MSFDRSLKSCGVQTTRFSMPIWSCFNIIHEKVKVTFWNHWLPPDFISVQILFLSKFWSLQDQNEFTLFTQLKGNNALWQITGNQFKIQEHHAGKKFPHLELFWSAFFTHFPTFGLNTERYTVFSPNVGKCGKNVDQNNSE